MIIVQSEKVAKIGLLSYSTTSPRSNLFFVLGSKFRSTFFAAQYPMDAEAG